MRGALEAVALPADGGPQQRKLVAPSPAACAGDADQCVERCRQGGKAQSVAIGKNHRERCAQQRRIDIDAHLTHQAQAVGVGADEDVLAVVEQDDAALGPRRRHRAGSTAGHARGLEDGDLMTGIYRGNGCSQTCPAGADDAEVHRLTGVPAPAPATPARAFARG